MKLLSSSEAKVPAVSSDIEAAESQGAQLKTDLKQNQVTLLKSLRLVPPNPKNMISPGFYEISRFGLFDV